ncbi:MAG: hypothetical protein MJZ60_04800 [Bacteroidaceae bacterium]|nr:hypothetical protein [Bacteroidaceae bacterium]
MKKLFFAIAAMFVTMTASAQFPGGGMQFNPEDMAKRQADRVKEVCKINDDQYKKILNFFVTDTKAMMARMDSLMNAGGGMPQFDPADMQKRRDAQNKAIKGILTEDQFKAYTKDQEERMARMRQGGFGGFGGGN